ncbi:VF530 family protein [Thalassotalea agarivorans]|uniref:Uncharacterized conserved protein n=1 Tax=Thalassotalea agarivorans TaxID=349064 RepID=A0A1I0B3G5_THASX|nr:VF530 family protein [Thalassotalea agarivorans]SET01208.1 Uncharacterized conserved protein [Thalassotalea agarivorans]
MTHSTEQYQNNPLHGQSLEKIVTELVEHYGFDILSAYLNLNCFKNNPSVKASTKFLKKTDWARHKVESFYLYQFKSLPRASDEQFELPPRDRIIPMDQKAGEPKELSLEDAERLREKRMRKAQQRDRGNKRGRSNSRRSEKPLPADPWANHR